MRVINMDFIKNMLFKKNYSIIAIYSLVLSLPIATNADEPWPKLITKDTPGAIDLDYPSEQIYISQSFDSTSNNTINGEIGSDCFRLIVERRNLQPDTIDIHANNQCPYIVKLVRFVVHRARGKLYVRPDIFIEPHFPHRIYTTTDTGDSIFAKGHYFIVNHEVQSNTLN